MSSFLRAAQNRKDEVYHRLKEDDALDDNKLLSMGPVYHWHCFSSYTSKTNIPHAAHSEIHTLPRQMSAQHIHKIVLVQLINQLFVCALCNKIRCGQGSKLCITNNRCDNRCDALIEAARKLGDHETLMKIQEEDLIAKEAPYHNYCMTKYILRAERSSITLSTPVAGVSQEAFQKLVDEIKQNVIILGKAFTLSYLLKILNFNPNIFDSYKPANLQRKLDKYFGDEITVLPQYGQEQSNFIFSSSVTLADAVKAASKAKSDTKRENPSIFTLPSSYEQSDDLILHQAVCIMRKEMAKLETDSTTLRMRYRR